MIGKKENQMTGMGDHAGKWQVFIENRDEVVAALERGECDGILPAARGFLDGFAQFLLESGVLSTLETFPDGRQRHSIPILFFCNTLIHRPLFSLPRLAPIERTFSLTVRVAAAGVQRPADPRRLLPELPAAASLHRGGDSGVLCRCRGEGFPKPPETGAGQAGNLLPWPLSCGLWVMDSVHMLCHREHIPRLSPSRSVCRASGKTRWPGP